MDDLSQLKNDFSMIHALVSIVEDLNLNTRIWSKNKNESAETEPVLYVGLNRGLIDTSIELLQLKSPR